MAASQPTWRKAYQPAEYIIDLNHSARAEQSRETQLSHRFKSVHPQADISNALDNPRWSMFCGPGINICTLATARGPSWVAASFQRMQHNAAMKPENSFGSSKKPCLFQCCTFFALFQSLTCDVRSLKAQTYIYIYNDERNFPEVPGFQVPSDSRFWPRHMCRRRPKWRFRP